jgi:Raf kinase inhibitor-like YbhB/YbcL family protein
MRASVRAKLAALAGVTTAITAIVSMAGSTLTAQQPAAAPARVPPLIMTSTAWEDGGVIPDKFTQAVPNAVSPELKWTQVPPGTQSFAILMHDPEPVLNKGSKMDITHWLIWNIPGTSTGLPEGVAQGELADGSRQVSLRANAYMGPGAPAGPYHHYTFELYALDTTIDVPHGANEQDTRTAVLAAMNGHILGKAVMVGLFKRPQ